jgi:hypothetical protein
MKGYQMLEIEIIFKIIGTVLVGIGSILLAWRVKVILKWVVYTLTAHEISISELIKILNNQPQEYSTITGATKHLIEVEDKIGFYLLISGFMSLGIGMFFNLFSIIMSF